MLTKKENLKGEAKPSKSPKNASSTPETYTQENHTSSPTKTPSPQTIKNYASPSSTKQDSHSSPDKKNSSKTRITIKYDAGFPNQLYIRGKGANLSWDKGQPLKNVKPDEWVWETDTNFTHCEFKVLIMTVSMKMGIITN